MSFAVVGEAGTERNGEDPESKAGITEWIEIVQGGGRGEGGLPFASDEEGEGGRD